MRYPGEARARPFLKWAGGKARLAPLIAALAPEGFGRYHEPFVGAGAVFFELAPQRARLGDANANLIEAYAVVRDAPLALVATLEELAARYLGAAREERGRVFYAIRGDVPSSAVGRAARLIFLNRTCFNGLYRENRKGEFNVPHGRYAEPRIVDAELIAACAAALSGVELSAGDFDQACDAALAGDFVYLDPPYHPLSATAKFTSYTAEDFGYEEQVRLRDAFDRLSARRVAAVLSNSDHEDIRSLYGGRGYRMETVTMSRAINSDPARRGGIPELLVRNF